MSENFNLHDLSKFNDIENKPTNNEKNNNAEISTPYILRQEMLNAIPDNFWEKPRKVFEPCCGKGGFLIDIINRFDNGLKSLYPDDKTRYEIIIQDCLYFIDINKTNVLFCEKLLNLLGNFKINSNKGNTLKLNIYKKWKLKGFDAIIGNPPYQIRVGLKKTEALWNKFVLKLLNDLNQNGYLLLVNPSGWRSPSGKFRNIFDEIMSRNLIYLNMNSFTKGKQMFNVSTNYDYYLLQNNKNYINTIINDIDDKINNINLINWNFIPSGNFNLFEKLIFNKEKKVNIIYSRSLYGTDKINMNETENKKYKFPCCYTITKKNGIKCFYSNIKHGHFGIPKIIWSNGNGTYPVIDKDGKYGLTQFSYAIEDDKNNLESIKKAMNNHKFLNLMSYVQFQSHKYNYKVIGLFKNDFWKEFLN